MTFHQGAKNYTYGDKRIQLFSVKGTHLRIAEEATVSGRLMRKTIRRRSGRGSSLDSSLYDHTYFS